MKHIKVTVDFTLVLDGAPETGIPPWLESQSWLDAVVRGIGHEEMAAFGVKQVVPGKRKLAVVPPKRSTST